MRPIGRWSGSKFVASTAARPEPPGVSVVPVPATTNGVESKQWQDGIDELPDSTTAAEAAAIYADPTIMPD